MTNSHMTNAPMTTAQSPDRPSLRRWCVSRSIAWLMLACCAGLSAGCFGKPAPSEGVTRAKQTLLSIGKSQDALDALTNEKTPDAHFLRAVAFFRLHLNEPANVELKKALELSPDNPVFRSYQICMEIQAGDLSHADELLKLYEDHKSSGPIALFSVASFAKKGDLKSATTAFRTSVALSDEAPEFLPEMLNFALTTQQNEEAQTILSKMDKISPDDPLLTSSRIAVLMLGNKYEEAQRKAKVYYNTQNHSESSGLLYCRTLTSTASSPDRDDDLAELTQRFPRNLNILTMYVTYLARTKRLPQAVDLLNKAADIAGPDARSTLVNIAIDLPLEAGDIKLTESQLARYRPSMPQDLLLTFYEARILVLKKDSKGAIAKFQQIVEAAKKENSQGSRAMAYQSLLWLRKLQEEGKLQDGMQKLLDKTMNPPAPVVKKDGPVNKDGSKEKPVVVPGKDEAPKSTAKVEPKPDEAPKDNAKVEAPKKEEPKKDEPSKVESR